MSTKEYRELWKDSICLCEMESNKDEAISFVMHYYDNYSLFDSMDDKKLLVTFIGLVIYEQKYHLKFGSTTPASFCYRELLKRVDLCSMDKDFVYDVGDWAADYSDNDYVPMGNYHGFGPRQYFAFWNEYESRVASEKQAKEERLERKRAEGKAKVEAAKQSHFERLNTIQQLREKPLEDSILIIEKSDKNVFYYYELIEEWFKNNYLNENQKKKILSMFPTNSTRHNMRKIKVLESYDIRR